MSLRENPTAWEEPMKLEERVSWLMGTLQRYLFPRLEECGARPLTEKEQQLASILEVLQIEKFAGRPPRRFGRKPWERPILARAFVAKAVYNHPHPRATIEALRGAQKVGLRLMFGVIALFADQLLKLIS